MVTPNSMTTGFFNYSKKKKPSKAQFLHNALITQLIPEKFRQSLESVSELIEHVFPGQGCMD